MGGPGPAHGYAGLQQGLADRLGIDPELYADRDTGESQGVRRNRSFDVVRVSTRPLMDTWWRSRIAKTVVR